jgi:hypothetical protein
VIGTRAAGDGQGAFCARGLGVGEGEDRDARLYGVLFLTVGG